MHIHIRLCHLGCAYTYTCTYAYASVIWGEQAIWWEGVGRCPTYTCYIHMLHTRPTYTSYIHMLHTRPTYTSYIHMLHTHATYTSYIHMLHTHPTYTSYIHMLHRCASDLVGGSRALCVGRLGALPDDLTDQPPATAVSE